MYITVSFKDFIEDPIGVLGSSGLVVYGGLIAGVLCNLIYVKIKKLSFLEYFDLVMPEISAGTGLWTNRLFPCRLLLRKTDRCSLGSCFPGWFTCTIRS
ncbi:MAG: prolipoprotein diacylglyceryl transferase family protein [Lachnospira eligens]